MHERRMAEAGSNRRCPVQRKPAYLPCVTLKRLLVRLAQSRLTAPLRLSVSVDRIVGKFTPLDAAFLTDDCSNSSRLRFSTILAGKEMVRFLRKCRRIDDLAVMEASQMVGVRTRAMTVALAAASTSATVEAEGEVISAKRRREEAADSRLGEMQMSLRNRSLVITQWLSRSTRNSRRKRRECVEHERMSRCSSISSCDALEEHEHIRLPSSRTDETPCKDIVSSMCNENCSQDRSEMSWPCSAQVSCPIELESTVGRQLLQSTPQSSMPCLSEIEEFFAAMENAEKKRFAMRYNFDIDEDVPLEGRYEWVRINKK